MSTAAGPARRVVIVAAGGLRIQGGPAQPITLVTDDRPVSADPPIVVAVVTGRAVAGGPVLPCVAVAASTVRIDGGPVLPVTIN